MKWFIGLFRKQKSVRPIFLSGVGEVTPDTGRVLSNQEAREVGGLGGGTGIAELQGNQWPRAWAGRGASARPPCLRIP
jgi:hypothetical protein